MPDDLPSSWVDLLRRAEGRPDGVLSLIDADGNPTIEQIAERLTDRGFFKVASARRYQLTEAGRAALVGLPGLRRRKAARDDGWLRRLFRRQ